MLPFYEETSSNYSIFVEKCGHISPHLHQQLELVYVLSGSLELGIGQELYHMEQGDLAFIFPGLIRHMQVFSPGDNKALHILCAPGFIQAFSTELIESCPAIPILPAKSLHDECTYILGHLSRHYLQIKNSKGAFTFQDTEKQTPLSDLLMHAYMEILLVRCMPMFSMVPKGSVGSEDIIFRTVSYISEHFREPVTLPGMAHDLGVSQYTLSRVFSGTFHRNFNQYLNEMRLEYAVSLLQHTDHPITEVWLSAGFESQRTFNRVFKEHYHVSPREFKQRTFQQ